MPAHWPEMSGFKGGLVAVRTRRRAHATPRVGGVPSGSQCTSDARWGNRYWFGAGRGQLSEDLRPVTLRHRHTKRHRNIQSEQHSAYVFLGALCGLRFLLLGTVYGKADLAWHCPVKSSLDRHFPWHNARVVVHHLSPSEHLHAVPQGTVGTKPSETEDDEAALAAHGRNLVGSHCMARGIRS